jgi:tRNA1(Val) A37 N6-methylase TrmN6
VPTPPAAAAALAAWVAEARPRTLLEPGAGGFAFARAARRLLPDVMVTGVEVDADAVDRAFPAETIVADFLDPTALAGRTFDAILCNPPYVRHHYLDRAYKDEVAARLGARFGVRLSRLSGTHVYFLLRALELLAPGGRAAFLTGAEWLRARYGEAVLALLRERAWLRAVVTVRPEDDVFPGVLTTAAAILVEAAPGPCSVADDLTYREWLAAVPRGGVARARRPPVGVPLARWFRVRRGVATGANRFFVLTDGEARAHRLPRACLVPCVASPRDLTPRWLFRARRLCPAVRAYLRAGEADGVAERYLCRTRDPWWRVEDVAPAPILVAYMARGRVAIVENDGAVHLNLFHGIYPREGTPPALVRALGRWLASPAGQAALLGRARTYAGGLRKLEPRDLLAVPLPDDLHP